MNARVLAAAAVASAAVLSGCRSPRAPEAPPGSPEACVFRLFRLAGETSPPRAHVVDVVDEATLDAHAAAFSDALESLRPAASPRVLRVDALPGPQATAVDLEATLPGNGRAAFTVQTVRRPDGTWRVTGFWGPGVDWPPRPRPSGEGTSTSSAPPR